MIDTVSNDVNNKSSLLSQHDQAQDIVSVKRLGVTLSVLRKLEK